MSIMYCMGCDKIYAPTVPCPDCGLFGSRVEIGDKQEVEWETVSSNTESWTFDTGVTQ